MRIDRSIVKSIEEMLSGDHEAAMLHACNAIDATARLRYPQKGNSFRMTTFIRDEYALLELFSFHGLDLEQTRWSIILDAQETRRSLDTAEVIYKVHRCSHAHGDDLPQGFALTHSETHWVTIAIDLESGAVQLPTSIVWGLLAMALLAPENSKRLADDDTKYLSYTSPQSPDPFKMHLNQWWGRRDDIILAFSS